MDKEEYFSSVLNRVYCGSTPDELFKFPQNKIALTITSPPFFDDNLYTLEDGSPEFGWNTYEEYLNHIKNTLDELFRVTNLGGRLILVLSNSPRTNSNDQIIEYWPIIHDTVVMARKIGWSLQDEAVWINNQPSYPDIKPVPAPETQLIPHHDWITVLKKPSKNKRESREIFNIKSTWELPNEGPKSKYSKSYGSFPDHFIENCIKCWTLPSEVILDPYAGSGQTIRVALRMKRKGIGIEADPKWSDLWEDINQNSI